MPSGDVEAGCVRGACASVREAACVGTHVSWCGAVDLRDILCDVSKGMATAIEAAARREPRRWRMRRNLARAAAAVVRAACAAHAARDART
jgi:hypothetical protein